MTFREPELLFTGDWQFGTRPLCCASVVQLYVDVVRLETQRMQNRSTGSRRKRSRKFTLLLGCFGKASCPVVRRRPFICQFFCFSQTICGLRVVNDRFRWHRARWTHLTVLVVVSCLGFVALTPVGWTVELPGCIWVKFYGLSRH